MAKELRHKVYETTPVIIQPVQKGIITAFALNNKTLSKKSNLSFLYHGFLGSFPGVVTLLDKISTINEIQVLTEE